MKKLLILIPAFLLILVGCSSMGDMEEAYNTFKTNMSNGYVATEEFGGETVTLDFTSTDDYTVSYKSGTETMELVCKGEKDSTISLDGVDVNDSEFAAQSCQTMYDAVLEDVKANIEHEGFYDSSYNTKYEKTDDGFRASGQYESGDEEYELTVNADSTKVEFKDGTGSIKVELK